MAQVQNTFEGGSSGATITPANSGGASGTPFYEVEIITGATCTYSTTASNGSIGASITGNGAHALLGFYMTDTNTLSFRFYIRIPSNPTSEVQIVTPRSSTDYIGGLNLNTSGKIKVTAAPGELTLYTCTNALALNTWYRVEISWSVATATTGAVQFKYFAGNSTTAIESYTTTTANLGTLPIYLLRMGKIGNSGNSPMFLDSVAYDPATVSLLGPYAAINIAPIANAGAGGVNIEPGVTCTLNGSASTDPDGTIASYAWAQTSGKAVTLTGSGASRTFTAPYTLPGTVCGFQLTVTDNSGATATATVSFTVMGATERMHAGGVLVPAQWLWVNT